MGNQAFGLAIEAFGLAIEAFGLALKAFGTSNLPKVFGKRSF
jgi:hypothetical protein